ncbi:MAG: radical SAM protein [Rhodospirillaceae bacterium]|jgi:radical SAM superfamily enzyme YgiQ (UPF0313 family)|nr:radical SAM protein [Rhodospirillaceae bacterium]MBT5375153.1 radical SAM protein [Rhodospirillaceae bacterium]MBT5659565.1 radical SAM protein [Rhodospirillaceae bacterium]
MVMKNQESSFNLKEIEAVLARQLSGKKIKKVLFVNPPDSHAELFQYDTAKRGRYTNYPSYGLLILAQNLREIDVEVAVCNLNHEILRRCNESESPEDFDYDSVWKKRLDQEIEALKPDLICVTCMFTMTHDSFKKVCERAAKSGVPIAVGGVHVTNDVERVSREIPCISFAFLREGENALNTFVNVVNGNAEIEELGQLILLQDGKRYEVPFERMPTGDQLNVVPAWDLVEDDLGKKYGGVGAFYYLRPKETRFATILSNRGCRAQCTFCSVRNFNGMGVRQRDVSSVIDELELLVNEYGIGHVMWLDDDLLKDEARAISMFNEMARRNLDLTWDASNGLIAYSCVDEVIAAAAESGCIGVNIGMESGNSVMLKQVRKPGTVEHFLKAAEVLRKHEQIYASVLLMVGFPGETMRMVMDTINIAREMDLDWCRIAPLQPLPNTPIYNSMVAQGLIEDKGSAEVRFAGGAFGKQAEIERGLRLSAANFEEAFASIGLDDVPQNDQITDIWFYMNYHLNFHRLFTEERPEKIRQQIAMLKNLSDIIAPENGFALYFQGYLDYKTRGEIDPNIISRVKMQLETSEYWSDRFVAFGLSIDDLIERNFTNKARPKLLPEGYSGASWVA